MGVQPKPTRPAAASPAGASPVRPGVAPGPAGAAMRPGAVPGPDFRSGFACFAGRPNVGKSTLMNALVGTKIAITSSRPQTTRRAIRGIVHRSDAQLIIVDTPGLHRPRTLLGERLDSLVRATLTEVDVIGFCVPAPDRIGPGDKYLAAELGAVKGTPVVAIVTKTDLVPPERVVAQLAAVTDLGDWADIVPVSAATGFQLDVLTEVLVAHLPAGRPLYTDGELTDEPEQVLVAELIREAVLEGVRDELPHSIAVVVEEMGPRPDREELTDVHALMYVERPSQKSIVIGAKGARLKEVGTRARQQIEALLGTKVYLDLRVKVAKDWQRDPKQLRRLGFYDFAGRGTRAVSSSQDSCRSRAVKPSSVLIASMCPLPSVVSVSIWVSCGSCAASNSSMATLTSSPSRCPRCSPATAVSCWNADPSNGSTPSWVIATSCPLRGARAATV